MGCPTFNECRLVTLLRQSNYEFFRTIKTLAGCLSEGFRCLSWTAQLEHAEQNNKGKPNSPIMKEEIQFVTELKETRRRLNIIQELLASLSGATRARVSDFEGLRMSPDNWRKWHDILKPWVENPPQPSQDTRVKASKVHARDILKRHRVFLEASLRKTHSPLTQKFQRSLERLDWRTRQLAGGLISKEKPKHLSALKWKIQITRRI